MRRIAAVAAALVVLSLPAPLLAQKAFEGQVTMSMTAGDQVNVIEMFVKGNRVRTEMNMNGIEVYSILDNDAKQMSMVLPSQKMVMRQSMDTEIPAGMPEPKVTRTGQTDVVAGRKCDIILIDDGSDNVAELCGARGMGTFAGGGSQQGAPAWAKELEDFFTLRLREPKSGAVIMEATKIAPGPVDDAKFVVPADYQSMDMPSAP